MNDEKYLGRGIHNEIFVKSLQNGHLKQMLSVINGDNNLNVQIRKDYLNIYYKGGNIGKVNSENSVEFDKFYFYTEMKEIPKKEIENNAQIIKNLTIKRNALVLKFKQKLYAEYFREAKDIMDIWFKLNPKPERLEQHQLAIENQYNKSDYTILDIEYEVSMKSEFACTYTPQGKDKPKKPRFDIIAINRQGKVCVIELKKGTGALENTSGLKEHYDCYKQSIALNCQPFMNEMNGLLEQKQSFGLIDKRLKIESPNPEFMFAYSYDDKMSIEVQDKRFQDAVSKIGSTIHLIKIQKGKSKLLDS